MNVVILCKSRYTSDGHVRGTIEETPPAPSRVQWEIAEEVRIFWRPALGISLKMREKLRLRC